jgi:hypothetical protein
MVDPPDEPVCALGRKEFVDRATEQLADGPNEQFAAARDDVQVSAVAVENDNDVRNGARERTQDGTRFRER